MIFRICRAYAKPPFEGMDLFQDVIFQIWKSLPKFKRQSKLSTWIYRITLNTCLQFKRKNEKSNQLLQLESVDIKAKDDEQETPYQDEYEALQDCMFQLKDEDRSILILSLEELSYKEISTITGLTENNVAVRMKRIREKMYHCIQQKLKKDNGAAYEN